MENSYYTRGRDADRVHDKAVEKICKIQEDNCCGFLLMDNHGNRANKLRYTFLMSEEDVRYIPYAWCEPRLDAKHKRDKSEGLITTYDQPGSTQS